MNEDKLKKSNMEEEIDLKILINIFLRNKKLIFVFTIISFLIASFIALTKKRVWQGQFEIVLDIENKQNAGSSYERALEQFRIPGVESQQNNSINTEVGILESESILMPIFESIKNDKGEELSNINFASWKSNNLDIKLRKKTSILNISYKDSDKNRIIPVLLKISSAYQDYGGLNRIKSNQSAINYLENQILIYKEKSKFSGKKATEYAIDNDLSFSDIQNIYADQSPKNEKPLAYPFTSSLETSLNSQNRASVENIRILSANDIKYINFQIENIEKIKDANDIKYIGLTIESDKNDELFRKLDDIELELIEKRAKYNETDIAIKNLLGKRNSISQRIKERTIDYLKSRKLATEALIKSVEKPKDIILKGKELMREAQRDEATLIELENKLRSVKLSAEKSKEPWQLITKPTLNNIPVAPDRKKIALIGLITGFIISYLISLFKEKRTDIIFEESILENLLGISILKRFKMSNLRIEEFSNELTFKEINKISNNKIFIVLSSNLINESLKNIQNFFSKISKAEENTIDIQLITEDFSQINSENQIFFMTSIGKIKNQEIVNLRNRLKILNLSISGILLLED